MKSEAKSRRSRRIPTRSNPPCPSVPSVVNVFPHARPAPNADTVAFVANHEGPQRNSMASVLLLHYYSPNHMADWLDNTLRTVGIILTAGFVIVIGFFLLLIAMCAFQPGRGGSSNDGVFFMGIAIMVMLFGLLFILRLSRGISRSAHAPEFGALGPPPFTIPSGTVPASQPQAPLPASIPPGPPVAHESIPLRLSPASRKALNRLALAMTAQILLSGVAWALSQLRFWSAPVSLAPHNWTAILFGPFVLYHLPYAVLIYFLLNQPSRRALTWSCRRCFSRLSELHGTAFRLLRSRGFGRTVCCPGRRASNSKAISPLSETARKSGPTGDINCVE